MHLPPLRDRREDIPLLAEHFLAKYAERHAEAGARHFPRGAWSCSQAYAWPGNVRELENVIERAVALEQTPSVLPEILPAQVRGGTPVSGRDGAGAPERHRGGALPDLERGIRPRGPRARTSIATTSRWRSSAQAACR